MRKNRQKFPRTCSVTPTAKQVACVCSCQNSHAHPGPSRTQTVWDKHRSTMSNNQPVRQKSVPDHNKTNK